MTHHSKFDQWHKATVAPDTQRPLQFEGDFGAWGGADAPAEKVPSRRGFLKAAGLVLAGGAAGGGFVLWPQIGDFDPSNILPVAACEGSPLAVHAALFDGTNIPFATPQQMQAIRRQLRTDFIPSVERGHQLEVYALTSSSFAPVRRISGVCQPGRPNEARSFFETGRNLEADYQAFEEQALGAFQAAEASVSNPTQTPLIRGIDEVIKACRQRYGDVPLYLKVYSDCLQHEKDGPSVYVSRGRRDILAQGPSHPAIPTASLPNTFLSFHIIHRAEGRTRHGKSLAEQQDRMSQLLSTVYSRLSGAPVDISKIS